MTQCTREHFSSTVGNNFFGTRMLSTKQTHVQLKLFIALSNSEGVSGRGITWRRDVILGLV